MAVQPKTVEFALLREGSPVLVETATRNRVLRYDEAIHLGEQPGCRIFLPKELTGVDDYPLLVPSDGGWAVNLAHHALHGAARLPDDARVEGDLLPLVCGTRCRLEFGEWALLVRPAELPPRPAGKGLNAERASELGWYVASLLAHLAVLLVFVFWQPHDPIQILRSPASMTARVLGVEIVARPEKPPEPPEPEHVEEAEPEEAGARGSEIALAPSRSMAAAVLAPMAKPAPRAASKRPVGPRGGPRGWSELLVPQGRIIEIAGVDLRAPVGPGAGGVRVIEDGPSGPGGFDIPVFEPPQLDFGPTVGGPPVIEDLGPHKKRPSKLPRFTEKRPTMVIPQPPTLTGEGLPRSVIKKYVERQRGGIARCYKQAVQRDPDLEGKVTLRFTIGPSGGVVGARVLRSTLGHAKAESCMVARARTWRFPRPLGGAAVRVRYPFLFSTR